MCVAAVVVNSEQKKPTLPVKNQLEHLLQKPQISLRVSSELGEGRRGGKGRKDGSRGQDSAAKSLHDPKQHLSGPQFPFL